MTHLNEGDSHVLLNQLLHQADIIHQNELDAVVDKAEVALISSLGVSPYRDGNQWCVLLGNNIQDGVSGFGDTPIAAIREFNNNLYTAKA